MRASDLGRFHVKPSTAVCERAAPGRGELDSGASTGMDRLDLREGLQIGLFFFVRDGDMIRLVIDTRRLEGTVDLVSLPAAEFATRTRHPKLVPDPRVPADTRLWAALQNASGGSWGGCVYDVDRIEEVLRAGLKALDERNVSAPK